jgi:hypothetical protein
MMGLRTLSTALGSCACLRLRQRRVSAARTSLVQQTRLVMPFVMPRQDAPWQHQHIRGLYVLRDVGPTGEVQVLR